MGYKTLCDLSSLHPPLTSPTTPPITLTLQATQVPFSSNAPGLLVPYGLSTSYSLCSEHCSLRQSTPSNPGSGLTFPRRPGLTILFNTAILLRSTLPFQMGLFTHLYYLLIYDAYWWLSVSPHWNIAPQMQRSPSLPLTWYSAWQIFFGMTEFYLK